MQSEVSFLQRSKLSRCTHAGIHTLTQHTCNRARLHNLAYWSEKQKWTKKSPVINTIMTREKIQLDVFILAKN